MREKRAAGSRQWAVQGPVKNLEPSPLGVEAADIQRLPAASRGFTLIELVITLTVLTILTMGVIPLVKISVRRQREQRLRDELRMMRMAIDQFHREALAGPQGQQGQQQAQTPQQQQQQQQQQMVDPRIRVAITDT